MKNSIPAFSFGGVSDRSSENEIDRALSGLYNDDPAWREAMVVGSVCEADKSSLGGFCAALARSMTFLLSFRNMRDCGFLYPIHFNLALRHCEQAGICRSH